MYERHLTSLTLGRYQLLVAIARGGMGQVWLGQLQGARGFNKVVAVKTLLPDESDRPRLERMLAEEARLASLIQHPNVVHTLDLGEHEGMLYLVMEWVDGESLTFLHTRANERGGMPIAISVALISQVLSGLHAVHELSDERGPLGVVHRDVSPNNILVTYDGVAKLVDFGIAKATHQPASTTEAGEIKGRFTYMSPEQILGDTVDRRCDVFATGIVLYYLTTGRHPFEHDGTAALIHALASDAAATPPSQVIQDFPAELERVLLKALEKDVHRRWPSAEAMRAALEQAVPEAFGDGGRAALRQFMERAVADRKVARREAVRRAQLAANYRDSEARLAVLQSSADSVASLRAISISQDLPEVKPLVAARVQSLRPKPPVARAPWLAAAAGVLVAVAAMTPLLLSQRAGTRGASPDGVAAGAALPSPAATSVVLSVAPSAAPSAVSLPAASSALAASGAPAASSAPATLAAPKRAVTPPRPAVELLTSEHAR